MLMHPEMIVGLPIWLVGVLIAGLAVLGAIVIELIARRAVPLMTRQDHNAVASAMFTVIGTTYAVLLAFVATLASEEFNKARAVADSEAALVDAVYHVVVGLPGADGLSMQHDIIAYGHAVVRDEWPAQTRGEPVEDEQPDLAHLRATALNLRPTTIGDGNLHTLLLNELSRLAEARQARLLAAQTSIPVIVWFVLIAGGGITIAFGSFLGAPSLRMHVAMSSLLAVSGALVLLVIIALSNPFRGDLRISPEPYERALSRMIAG